MMGVGVWRRDGRPEGCARDRGIQGSPGGAMESDGGLPARAHLVRNGRGSGMKAGVEAM
jgi:hypothetical protein